MSNLHHYVHRPHASLAHAVREIIHLRSDAPRAQVLLPEPGLTIALWVSGSATLDDQRLPAAVISGLQRHHRTAQHSRDATCLAVRFTSAGAQAFLRDRSDLLWCETVPLEAVLGAPAVSRVLEQVHDAATVSARIHVVERMLMRRLRNGTAPAARIHAAVRAITASRGRVPIPVVAKTAAMSERALERGFQSVVGASPKHLSRLVRLGTVCDLWDAGRDCTEIAYAAGYADQPHLVRDFKALSGAPPHAFFTRTTPRNLPVFYK